MNVFSYDSSSGRGSIGVEFAVTAVSSSACSACKTPKAADVVAKQRVTANPDLHWNENHYRGFYTLSVDTKSINTTFYGMKDVSNQNLNAFVLAEFSVKEGKGPLQESNKMCLKRLCCRSEQAY